MNKQEALEFINEYFSQNNCGTAYPIYFSIRDSEYVPISVYDDADKYMLVVDCDVLGTYDSLVNAVIGLRDSKYYEVPECLLNEDHEDYWDFDCIFEKFCEDNSITCAPVKKQYTYKGMFLLKSEAQDHLESNKHHYSNDAIVYCEHAWRSERQKDFLESVKKILEDPNINNKLY